MPETDLARHLDDLDARVGALSRRGRVTSTYRFLGFTVAFHAVDSASLDVFTDPFANVGPSGEEPRANAYLLRFDDVADASIFTKRGLRASVYDPAVGSAWYDPGTATVRISDHHRSAYYLVYKDVQSSEWRRPEFSRTFIETILREAGTVSLHGATVGDANRCLLLTAKGGSGKSTLVAHALKAGYKTVGDDYLLYAEARKPAAVGEVGSAFRTIKVTRTGSAARLFRSDPTATSADGSKHLLHPGDEMPQSFVSSQMPVAIGVPAFGRSFDVQPVNRVDVLRALLPTSAQMSMQPGRMVAVLTRLTEALPCFRVTLSPDFDSDCAALGQFLTSLGISTPTSPDRGANS